MMPVLSSSQFSFDDELPSPSFCVDIDIVRRNTNAMLERATRAGVTLRPHVKTHKTIPVALYSCGTDTPADARIVVSTLAEAEFFAAAGFTDVLYAIPMEPSKFKRAFNTNCSVMVDSVIAVNALRDWALKNGSVWRVWIAVDATCYAREGCNPEVAQVIATNISGGGGGVTLAGLYSHSGNSYSCSDAGVGAQRVAALERDVMSSLAQRLRDMGIMVPAVSVGATPSASVAENWAGITELHPGNYCFYDRQQVASGSCCVDDIAGYVIARVVAIHNERGEALIDAGATALHKDTGGLADWGEVLGRPELILRRMTQELSVVGHRDNQQQQQLEDLAIGDVLRILPNHVCMTAAGHNTFYAVRKEKDGRRRILGTMEPCRGW